MASGCCSRFSIVATLPLRENEALSADAASLLGLPWLEAPTDSRPVSRVDFGAFFKPAPIADRLLALGPDIGGSEFARWDASPLSFDFLTVF